MTWVEKNPLTKALKSQKAALTQENTALSCLPKLDGCLFITGGKGLEQSFREVSMDTIGEEFLLRAQFNVSGLNCASCVAKVEKHLKKKSGK
jgi:hypothetical protein